jgi:hypothetical protein
MTRAHEMLIKRGPSRNAEVNRTAPGLDLFRAEQRGRCGGQPTGIGSTQGVIYVPMFIGIYVLSRWIESKLSATPPSVSPEADSELPSKGFMAKSPKL